MPTSEEDLEAKRQRNVKLREQIEAEHAKRVTREREAANDIVAVQLDVEGARLESELASAKEAAKVSTIKQGTAAPMANAKDAMAAAVEAQKAAAATPPPAADGGK